MKSSVCIVICSEHTCCFVVLKKKTKKNKFLSLSGALSIFSLQWFLNEVYLLLKCNSWQLVCSCSNVLTLDFFFVCFYYYFTVCEIAFSFPLIVSCCRKSKINQQGRARRGQKTAIVICINITKPVLFQTRITSGWYIN